METETYYEVRVVGRIWQPGFTASHTLRVNADDLMEYTRADGETDADYELRMVQCTADRDLGDFSAVDGWQIVKVTRREDCSGCGRAQYNETQLVDFTEDQEYAYLDTLVETDYLDDLEVDA